MQVDPLAPDTGIVSLYDTVWTSSDVETYSSTLERIMLADDKIFVVLTVVLIIWFGLIFFILRTDKRLKAVERSASEGIPPEASESRRTS